MKKHNKQLATFMAILFIFTSFTSMPLFVRAATATAFNWANINVSNFNVSQNIYLQSVFHTGDGINVGIAHNWGATGDDGDFFVTSTDMVNWHIQGPFTSLGEVNGTFFGATPRGLIQTDLANSWQMASFPEHVGGWPSMRFFGNDLWIGYSYNDDWDRQGGMHFRDGTWHDYGYNLPTRGEEDWERTIPNWPFPDTYYRLERQDFVNSGEQLNISYITLAPGGEPQLVRIFLDGRQVSLNEEDVRGNWPTTANATVSASNIQIDGVAVDMPAFNIAGNNFFRLRDLAYALEGSNRTFNVDWSAENNALNILPWNTYQPVGGELSPVAPGDVTATLSNVDILLWYSPVNMTAYNIGGYNFFMLRDIAAIVHVGVEFDGGTNTINLITTFN